MAKQWSEKEVAKRFEQSVTTLQRLPPVRVQSYFNAWPEIVRTQNEIDASEPMPLRLRATPDQITQMEHTLKWIIWVDVDERRLIWHRAARRRWKTICWELGCDRSTAWRKWNIALVHIPLQDEHPLQ